MRERRRGASQSQFQLRLMQSPGTRRPTGHQRMQRVRRVIAAALPASCGRSYPAAQRGEQLIRSDIGRRLPRRGRDDPRSARHQIPEGRSVSLWRFHRHVRVARAKSQQRSAGDFTGLGNGQDFCATRLRLTRSGVQQGKTAIVLRHQQGRADNGRLAAHRVERSLPADVPGHSRVTRRAIGTEQQDVVGRCDQQLSTPAAGDAPESRTCLRLEGYQFDRIGRQEQHLLTGQDRLHRMQRGMAAPIAAPTRADGCVERAVLGRPAQRATGEIKSHDRAARRRADRQSIAYGGEKAEPQPVGLARDRTIDQGQSLDELHVPGGGFEADEMHLPAGLRQDQ